MPNPEINDLLNDLLVQIHRSLVQYVYEAWPWTHDGDEQLQAAIDELAHCQQEDARSLFQMLLARGERPELGVYPADFTSLHFVSLDYLYPLLVKGQEELVQQLQAALDTCADDAQAHSLLQQILASQQRGLERLRSITPAPTVAA